MQPFPWYLLPALELVRFKKIDFFPAKPHDFNKISSLCIGTKTRTIGDALVLTTVPEKLKKLFPHLRVTFYPRAFNPVVFYGNPFVDGIDYLPNQLYGDDSNWGQGHLIQLKEQFFGLPITDPPKPKIYLQPHELSWAEKRLNSKLPVCVIHPWGHTWKNVATLAFWTGLVDKWKTRFHFLQVGLNGQTPVPGCEDLFMVSKSPRHARKLFSLVSRADCLIGVNSGPMHIARAFDLPSLILTEEGSPKKIFDARNEAPYFLKHNYAHSFLYEQNQHFDIGTEGLSAAQIAGNLFLEKALTL